MQHRTNFIWLLVVAPFVARMFFSPVLAYGQPPQTPELADPKPHDAPAVWQSKVKSPQFSWGSIDVRYKKYNVPAILRKNWNGHAWRGEQVNAQAVFFTPKQIEGLTVKAGALSNGSSIIPQKNVKPYFVHYVMTDELNKDGKGGCSDRPDKTKWDSSLVADRLEAGGVLDVEANSVRPVWLRIDVPQQAKPGIYKGTITISGKGIKNITLPYSVKVSSRTLPSANKWPYHLNLWQNPYSVARYFNVPLWTPQFYEKARPYFEFLASMGQKVITTTLIDRPWNGQTEDAFHSMVKRTRNIDGSWSYDYTVFDQWVEFMQSLGVNEQIDCYTLVPWKLEFDYFDEATSTVKRITTAPGEKAYEDYWLPLLRDFAKHLKEKGWFEKTCIAMDERPIEAMRGALSVIHKADPQFKVSGAMTNFMAEIEPQIYNLSLAYADSVPSNIVKRRRAEGKVTTFYTCCAEAYPNTFTFSDPAEGEWTPWHALAVDLDGHLRWAYNSWTANCMQDSRFRSWAAGDTYMVYPTGPSIRALRLKDGLEDAEKVRILRTQLKGNELKRLNTFVSHFTAEWMKGNECTKMIEQARNLLDKY